MLTKTDREFVRDATDPNSETTQSQSAQYSLRHRMQERIIGGLRDLGFLWTTGYTKPLINCQESTSSNRDKFIFKQALRSVLLYGSHQTAPEKPSDTGIGRHEVPEFEQIIEEAIEQALAETDTVSVDDVTLTLEHESRKSHLQEKLANEGVITEADYSRYRSLTSVEERQQLADELESADRCLRVYCSENEQVRAIPPSELVDETG